MAEHAQMTTVYLVTSGGQMDGDYVIHGVYSTEALAKVAEQDVEKLGKIAFIETFELDPKTIGLM